MTLWHPAITGLQQEMEFDGPNSPASVWQRDAAKRVLDELFSFAKRYRTTKEFAELIDFVKGFKRYSPFNAMLVHTQKPGAKYVLPAERWERDFGRTVLPNAQALVMLRPMGPVMFAFDVSDTEGEPLPNAIIDPFQVAPCDGDIPLERTIENAKRDGVRTHWANLGSQMAGSIRWRKGSGRVTQEFREKALPVYFDLLLPQRGTRAVQYATLVHELAHLYCGHLGTPDPKWWPDRRGLDQAAREFEAESVAHMVCGRLGLGDIGSGSYLSGYLQQEGDIPSISLDCILRVAGVIEDMGKRLLSSR